MWLEGRCATHTHTHNTNRNEVMSLELFMIGFLFTIPSHNIIEARQDRHGSQEPRNEIDDTINNLYTLFTF